MPVNYNHCTISGKIIGTLYFFPNGCIGDHHPYPTPNTMLSFIYLTLRLKNIVIFFVGGGGGAVSGVCKTKYEVLKSKDFVTERCSIKRSKYVRVCHLL